MIFNELLPLPLEVLRPRGAPTIGPPPRPVSRSTAALFTDMEKFLCKYKWERGGKVREKGVQLCFMHMQHICQKKKKPKSDTHWSC